MLVASAILGLTDDAIVAKRGSGEPDEADPEILARVKRQQQLEGRFEWPGFPIGLYVVPTADRHIVTINLYARDPVESAMTYNYVEEDVFRRKRKDDSPGETLVFERDANGQVMSLLTHGYRYSRTVNVDT